jgi:hypothetical protein
MHNPTTFPKEVRIKLKVNIYYNLYLQLHFLQQITFCNLVLTLLTLAFLLIAIDILYVKDDGSSHDSDGDSGKYENNDEENDSDKDTNENNKRKIGTSIHAVITKLKISLIP